MIDRESVQQFLRSIGQEAAANDQAMLCLAEAIVGAVVEKCAKAAEEYGEVSFEVCSDNILMDPLLRGGQWTEENVKLSDSCSINSTIGSAGFHAAQHIAENIRGLFTTRFRGE